MNDELIPYTHVELTDISDTSVIKSVDDKMTTDSDFLSIEYLPQIFDHHNVFDVIFSKHKRNQIVKKEQFYYKDTVEDLENILCLVEVAINVLNNKKIRFDKSIWYMDVIRYDLSGETDVDSGLAWHSENINYDFEVISVLIYFRKDKTIRDGNLRYKEYQTDCCCFSKTIKKTIIINATNLIYNDCTVVIMDGNVTHKPEKCSGFGRRELINVSFSKTY
jgi:hypothetical protein